MPGLLGVCRCSLISAFKRCGKTHLLSPAFTWEEENRISEVLFERILNNGNEAMARKQRKHLHSFTLTDRASRVVDTISHGQKSAMVSLAIIWYFSTQENPNEVAGSGQVANDETNHVPPGWGKRLILHLKRSFQL